MPTYESTLNTWLAETLRAHGLDAKPESSQGGNKRLDVEVNFDEVKIALEAEQGKSTAKKAEALKDADGRLRDDLADCAIAICYPDGLQSNEALANCELIYALRTHKNRPTAAKTTWTSGSIEQIAGVIRQVPQQMGDPDEIAQKLSVSLEVAIDRLSESQKQHLAATLDLPPGKPIKLEFGRAQTSRYNQAAKRAMLVIATAVMFQARLDSVHEQIPALMDNRKSPPTLYSGQWPPPGQAHAPRAQTLSAHSTMPGICGWSSTTSPYSPPPATHCMAAPTTTLFQKPCAASPKPLCKLSAISSVCDMTC